MRRAGAAWRAALCDERGQALAALTERLPEQAWGCAPGLWSPIREMAQKQAAIAREVRDAAAWILRAFVPRAKAQEILVVGEGLEQVSLQGRHSTALGDERRAARLREAVNVSGIPRHKV